MEKYKNLLFFILFVIIIFSLIVANNKLYDNIYIENFTQINENNSNSNEITPLKLQEDDSMPFSGFENDVPDTNKSKNTKSNNTNLPMLSSIKTGLEPVNQIFAQEEQIKATKGLLLDKKFANEHPELYDKIIKIVFKDFMSNPEEVEYKLTVSNKSCIDCPPTNLINSLSMLNPTQLHEIKVAIEEQDINAGNCNLSYPHPSYTLLNQFKELSTCNQDCKIKNRDGSCPPLAYNCLIQNTEIWD